MRIGNKPVIRLTKTLNVILKKVRFWPVDIFFPTLSNGHHDACEQDGCDSVKASAVVSGGAPQIDL